MTSVSAGVNVQIISRGALAAREFPPEWNDVEGFIANKPRDLHILLNNPLARDDGEPVQLVAREFYRKRRWPRLDTPKYLLARRSGRFLSRFLKSQLLGAIAAPPLDVALTALGAWARFRARRAVRGLSVSTCDQMSTEFDDLLRRPRARVASHRSAAWVNWLLASDAGVDSQHRPCYVRDSRNRVVGYFLNRRSLISSPHRGLYDVRVGTLKDWGIFDDQATDELSVMLLAVVELLRWRTDIVQLFSADPAHGRQLRKLGFRLYEQMTFCFHAVPPSPLVAPEYRERGC